MTRDTTTLTGRRFDLLVVGGGIHGLFAAYDAAPGKAALDAIRALLNRRRYIRNLLRDVEAALAAKATA